MNKSRDLMSLINGQIEKEEQMYKLTENGAIGYSTSGDMLVDLNFSIPEMRNMCSDELIDKKLLPYIENNINKHTVPIDSIFLKWLFYLRDVRYGLGERKIFRIMFRYMANKYPSHISHLIEYIPEYGRWDDLLILLDTSLRDEVSKLLYDQLLEDVRNMNHGLQVSLLGKWMPSLNAHSEERKNWALYLCKKWGMSYSTYRKILKRLRDYIDIVESKMSRGKWSEINYEAVPSRANLIYGNAFARNDPERRAEYLYKLTTGEKKINASVLFPHDILFKIINANSDSEIQTYEALWKGIPDISTGSNTIVVRDGSGSMCTPSIPKSNIRAIHIATALSIYFAERLSGPYRNKFITFSERPQIIELPDGSLLDKWIECSKYSEIANTNIEAVFSLLLNVAVTNKLKQEDMVDNILIISDMEFDGCAVNDEGRGLSKALFDVIAQQWKQFGYKLPRLIFWNIASRTGVIPMVENEMGVSLVSGYSINNIKMIMNSQLDPMSNLLSVLNTERYDVIETLPKYILRNNSSGEGIDSRGVEVFKAFLKSIGINMVEGH